MFEINYNKWVFCFTLLLLHGVDHCNLISTTPHYRCSGDPTPRETRTESSRNLPFINFNRVEDLCEVLEILFLLSRMKYLKDGFVLIDVYFFKYLIKYLDLQVLFMILFLFPILLKIVDRFEVLSQRGRKSSPGEILLKF